MNARARAVEVGVVVQQLQLLAHGHEVWGFKNGKFTVHVLDDAERVYRDLPNALRELEAIIRKN